MKKMIQKLPILALISVTFSGCSEDSVSDLTSTDIPTSISYQNDVRPIIQNNCLNCHGNPTNFGAPNSLTTYENVKASVLNNLIDRISRPEGTSGAMPLGGPRLSQNDINIIMAWQNADFPQ